MFLLIFAGPRILIWVLKVLIDGYHLLLVHIINI